ARCIHCFDEGGRLHGHRRSGRSRLRQDLVTFEPANGSEILFACRPRPPVGFERQPNERNTRVWHCRLRCCEFARSHFEWRGAMAPSERACKSTPTAMVEARVLPGAKDDTEHRAAHGLWAAHPTGSIDPGAGSPKTKPHARATSMRTKWGGEYPL